MKYIYKTLTIESYLESLYTDGFKQSSLYTNEEIKESISKIGIFRFKGYVKAFRQDVSKFSIDEIFQLHTLDRNIASKMFELSSKIEIKLKAYFIDTVYQLTNNPFFYLLKESYYEDFTLSDESIYDWEVTIQHKKQKSEVYLHYRDYYLANYDFASNKDYLENKEIIQLNQKLNINYPPFHYFVENMTLGALIKMISKLTINNQNILKLIAKEFKMYNEDVFLNYLLRLKEVRNRCAHNGRLFNRNYRGVVAYGNHKKFRKTIYEHKLIDVYYSLCLLLDDIEEIDNTDTLIENFKCDILRNCDENLKEFVINIMKTR